MTTARRVARAVVIAGGAMFALVFIFGGAVLVGDIVGGPPLRYILVGMSWVIFWWMAITFFVWES
jgi:hypothetical protein